TSDLIQPEGELSNSFFPDGDLSTQISGWLDKAKTRVEANADIAESAQDDAAAAWVYYLAYSYVASRVAAMPNSVSVNKGADSVAYRSEEHSLNSSHVK